MDNCYIAHSCPNYESGDNKPPNEDVRVRIPCVKFINDSCKMCLDLRLHHGETMACDVDKIKRVKGLTNPSH